MSQASDLVTLSRFDVRLSPDGQTYVHSTSTRSQPGKRSMKQDLRWQREHKHLGGGTFGQVYLEKCMEAGHTEEKRAVKRIAKIGRIDYKRELEALAVLSYKSEYQDFFVNFIGWYETDKHVCIAMELHELGSLDNYLLPTQASLPESEVKVIMAQVLKALDYMHELDFMHRDLKPANVLVVSAGPDWWVKVADFGFSKRAISNHVAAHTGGGTPLYMAPEMQGIVKDDSYVRSAKVTYTKAVDIWAVGVMTFQILAGRTPFHPGEIDRFIIGKLPFPVRRLRKAAVSDEACDFVRTLIIPQPNRRPNARECLRHYWFLPDTRLPGDQAYSSHSDSEEVGPVDELQEASATWSSEQASQAETSGRTSGSGKPTASNAALSQTSIPEAAQTVRPDTSGIVADDRTVRATANNSPDQYDTPRESDTDARDFPSTEDNRNSSSSNEKDPIQRRSQHHTTSTNDPSWHLDSERDTFGTNHSILRSEDWSSDGSEDSTKAVFMYGSKRLMYGSKQPQMPELVQEASFRSKDMARPDFPTRRGALRSAGMQTATLEPAVEREASSDYKQAAHGVQEHAPDTSFTMPQSKMRSHEMSARDYIEHTTGRSKPDQESARRASPPRKSARDKVGWARRGEDRPAVTMRKTPGKPESRSSDYHNDSEANVEDAYRYSSLRQPAPHQEPSSRPSPPLALSKDRVEYIKRDRDRPPVMVRRGFVKPRSEEDDAERPLHRERSRQRRPYSGQTSRVHEVEDPTPRRYHAESHEPIIGRGRKTTRSPAPIERRNRVASSPYPTRPGQIPHSPYPTRERNRTATSPNPSRRRKTGRSPYPTRGRDSRVTSSFYPKVVRSGDLYTPQSVPEMSHGRSTLPRGHDVRRSGNSYGVLGDCERPIHPGYGGFSDPQDIFAEFMRGGGAGKAREDASNIQPGPGRPTSGGVGAHGGSTQLNYAMSGFSDPNDIFAEFMRGGGANTTKNDFDEMQSSPGLAPYGNTAVPAGGGQPTHTASGGFSDPKDIFAEFMRANANLYDAGGQLSRREDGGSTKR